MFSRKFDWFFGKQVCVKKNAHPPVKKIRRGAENFRLEVLQLEDRVVMSTLLGNTANTFAVLAGSTVTSTGPTAIYGNVGVSPGSAITGFPPGVVTGGTAHSNDAVALQAQTEVTAAYTTLSLMPATATLTGQDLGGLTLTPGVYHFATTAQLTGALTLDGLGDPNAVFVFQIGSALTTASNSSVVFVNGANDDEVYWDVGSSATLGTNTVFAGNIIAVASITLNTDATLVCGRALAQTGAVTMDSNQISFACADISGRKINDVNGDGILQAAETGGVAGVTLYIDANNSNTFDIGEISTITDAGGNYTFANLMPGTYRIRELQQAGVVQTTPNPVDIVLAGDVDVTGVNFGDFETMSIAGIKYNDINGNGIRDAGDLGVAGVTIFLDTNNNGRLDSGERFTTSDANGNYGFDDLGPGTYRVREIAPAGTAQTTANPAAIVARSGTNVSGILIGNVQAPSSIGGVVFQDTNANGVRNAGEQGQAGWTVFIDTNGNGILDVGERRTTTNANGNYIFANVPPGTFQVREVEQPGWVQMTNNPAPITIGTAARNAIAAPIGNAWVASMMSASKLSLTGGNMATGMLATQARFVESLFVRLLHRAPSLAGLQAYIRLLQSGFNQQQVTSMFRLDFRV